MIKRERVNVENEFLLLSYMIMNIDVLAASFNRYKSGQLKPKHFTKDYRTIFRWLIRYYSKHKKPPKNTIIEIYKKNRKRLSSASIEITEAYLNRLSDQFAEYEDRGLDPDYIRNEVLPDFIREKEISERIEKAQLKLDTGDTDEAENIIATYTKITGEDEDENLGTILPYTKEEIRKGDSAQIKEVFRFEGDLDKVIGPLGSSWLVAVTGIEKVGKSYFLQEIAYRAVLYGKKKVLYMNFELNEPLARDRSWRRISRTAIKRDSGMLTYPVLDCENNQYCTCKILDRLPNKKPLFKGSSEIITFNTRINWKTCTKCKGKPLRKNVSRIKRFIPTIWFEKEYIREVTQNRVERSVKRNQIYRLENFRIKCFPRYSKNFDEAYEYVLRYIDRAKWKPDIIIFDYLDILGAEYGSLQLREDIDRKWKKGSMLAGELDCLVLTADQAIKASRQQYQLDQMSTSESKTKDAHLDVRIAINQTNYEKDLEIARVNVLFHRHSKFNIRNEVLITQRLATAEPFMENVTLWEREKKYKIKQS